MTTEELNAIIAKAEGGDVAAMNEVANVYANDANLKDVNNAYYWYSKSAEAGDSLGMANLGGWCYLWGNGTEKNFSLAVDWLEKAAEKGNDWAMNKLANDIYSKDNEYKNLNKAFAWYKKSAELGNVNSMSNLGGWCYLWGNGTEKNLALAVEWLEKAAEKGDVWSMERLTYNIYSQDNEFKDYDKACVWFEKIRAKDPFGWNKDKLQWDWLEKAAAEGNSKACLILGARCQREDKAEEAVSWFKKGAEAGDIQSMRELAWCYRTGKGIEENKSLALGLYEKAANAGDIQSMTDIVSLCQYDDKEKHDFWQKKAADAGNSWAQYYMGEDCVQKQDYDNAISWYVKSAQSRRDMDPDAASRMNALGVEFQYGNNGRTIDLPLAYKFYSNSAECGNSDGMTNAAYCLSNGIGVEKDFKKCFELYTKAAELGNQFGYSNLGWCYMYGNGTDKNVPEAIKWLTKAADEFGNIWSMNRLTDIYGTFEGYINQEQAAKWFLELIKRDSDPNSGVYGNTGYNKELYAKIKSAVLNSTTEEDMMSAMSGSNGGSLLGGAMSFTTSNAKSYINQAEEAIQRNIAYKAEQSQRAEEEDARRKAEEERARQEALRNEQEKQEREAWEARKKEIDRLLRELSSEEYHNIAVEDWKKIDYISVGIKWSELKRFMEDDSVQINRVDEIIKELEKENKIRKLVEEDCPYGLKEIAIGDFTIPVGTKRIGDQAFSDCIQLTSITIPDSVTCIEDSAFWNCVSLTDVKLPDSVVEFGGLVFQGCDSLTTPVYNAHIFAFLPDSYSEYAIPDGITTISSGAFWGWSLKSLRLPSSVTRIGWYAFKGVFSLRGIYVPKGKKALISRLLDGCEMNTEPEIIEE